MSSLSLYLSLFAFLSLSLSFLRLRFLAPPFSKEINVKEKEIGVSGGHAALPGLEIILLPRRTEVLVTLPSGVKMLRALEATFTAE